ncbi:2-C-methyl-D-erythritol 4-phosphate cytidylyltransferase [Marinicella sp. S1101]|uniref:2-C-methyl-D-erythritol 4-phosphate cytidylyltransferase n=1 Tax=Marinicella marina TaxID=2996016 RepID=UPI002260E483|nr:2-C-methyl-D-erythritol 4-phosphate cytidylyltransferase [Marinicella marina]MCX7552307.1 2-C-methyl-D-erythritol 4-phosphate cytidylyltransferase [Marinicella marina]MDJ1139182.1 2-C-methyl-D-erythritol 4-phosphate cytidylyltransferase [Marinicella marina]
MATDRPKRPHVIIVAAGTGDRFQKTAEQPTSTPKQYALIDDKPVLWHTIQAFNEIEVEAITVVLHPKDEHWSQFDFSGFKPPLQTCIGGNERHDSVRNGLLSIPDSDDTWVLVHDAARPCVSTAEIKALIQACQQQSKGGLLVKPCSDTIKKSRNGETVYKTINRDMLYAALTPQMFLRKDLLQALTLFEADSITDESSAIEAQGQHPIMVQGQTSNIKITTYEDLALARFILQQQGRIQ